MKSDSVVEVRDLEGKRILLLEDSAARPATLARDESGKVVAERVTGKRDISSRLSAKAATWMRETAVLMDLGQSDVATPATQAEYGIPTLDCVADLVSAVEFVTHDRGVLYEEDAANAIKPAQPAESVSGGVSYIDSSWNSSTFITVPYALGMKLPNRVLANADWDLKARSLKRLVEGLRLLREIRVAALLTLSTSYASANRVAVGAKWNGGTNASPITDVFAGLLASYLPANVLVLPELLAPYFFNGAQGTATTSILNYVQAGGPLPRIAIARAKKMVSGSPVYVWAPAAPANVALVRSTPDDLDKISTSRTFRWIGSAGDGETVDGMLVRFYEAKDEDCFYLVVSHNDKEVIVDTHVGAVLTGAYA